MMTRSLQSRQVKAATVFSSSNPNNTIENVLFSLLLLFLPTQLGKHFWPEFSYIQGIRVDYLAPTIYVTDILVFLLFIIWVLRTVTSLKNYKFKAPASRSWISAFAGMTRKIWNFKFVIFLIFLLYLLITILLSNHVLSGLYFLLKFLEFLFVGYYVSTVVWTKQQLAVGIILFSVSMVAQSVLAIAQFINHGSIGGLLYFVGERTFNSQTPGIANVSINGELILRPYGTFPHPNVLAGYLLCSLTVLAYLLSTHRQWFVRAFGMVVFGLGIVALGLTLSRVAIGLGVCFLLGLVFILLRKRFKEKKRLGGVVVGVAMVVLLCGVLAFSPLGSRFFQTSLSEESVAHRALLFSGAWQLFLQHPLIGVGLGNFLPSIAQIQKPLSLTQYLQPAHNIYLLLATELGIIGFVFFVWFLGKTIQHPKHFLCGMLFFTLLTIGLFDHYLLTLQQGQLLFAIVVGLCWVQFSPDFS